MRKEKEVDFGKRVLDALDKKGASLHDFARGIDKSYEMARRYSHGLSIPQDPKTLEKMAAYFGTTVGWLLAQESGANPKQHPAVSASELTSPVTETVILTLGDDAMLTVVGGIRLFGKGDQVLLSPARARANDIVAVKIEGNGASLRKLVEEEGEDRMVAANPEFPTILGGVVLGVVSEVRGRSGRFV